MTDQPRGSVAITWCLAALDRLIASRARWLLVVVAAAIAGVGGLGSLAKLRAPQSSAVQRGHALAVKLGCFGCHGPEGAGGIPNPGAREGEVPPLRAAATLPSYVQRDAELVEWVRDGRPARLATAISPPGSEPLIKMPAYGDHLTTSELSDLVEYLRAIGGYDAPADPRIAQGRELARARGCFGCHGEDGRASLPNPRSFKGVIPAWDSPDFELLVESEHELREWILDGSIKRFRESPLASYFLDRQAIQMPAYRDHLTSAELDQLVAYVQWVRSPTNTLDGQARWVVARAPAPAPSAVERGARLYVSTGCAACHGAEGRGGVANGRDEVPSLTGLADQLELFEPADVAAFVAAVNRGARLDDPATQLAIEDWARVQARYVKARDLVAYGAQVVAGDGGTAPPMPMPAWALRVHADPSPDLEVADIDAILAYLVALSAQPGGNP